MKKTLYYIFLAFLLINCQSVESKLEGIWRAEVPTLIGPIPFNLEFKNSENGMQVFAINGDEKLALDNAFFKDDSLHITMELFDAEIISSIWKDEMTGTYKKKLGNLEIRKGAFTASKGKVFRFVEKKDSANHNVTGKWATVFTDDEGLEYEAIGLFEQEGNEVSGTFLTSTGDYRYLAGNIVGDSLMLSCFDGTHIFLFKAQIQGDKLSGGHFTSSLLYHETWEAKRNDHAELPDPDSLTFLKEGYDTFDFSFENLDGEFVSLNDAEYKDKVVLVQILGSWCPNCMDESIFLGKWIEKNRERGVEVIGLAFEKSMDHDFAFPKIKRMKERFGMDYKVLLAGLNIKAEADSVLPMLNHVMSFPTTIYLDRNHKVRKIHTGFSGPGTGIYYDKFVEDFNRFMDLLITE